MRLFVIKACDGLLPGMVTCRLSVCGDLQRKNLGGYALHCLLSDCWWQPSSLIITAPTLLGFSTLLTICLASKYVKNAGLASQ